MKKLFRKSKKSSVKNIYRLDGHVPIQRAIPFGLQHILAMFVANIAPIMIVAGACGLTPQDTARLIQTAMIIAGIGTLIQLFPVWHVGSGLPVVMTAFDESLTSELDGKVPHPFPLTLQKKII